jgi:hypothetical protein
MRGTKLICIVLAAPLLVVGAFVAAVAVWMFLQGPTTPEKLLGGAGAEFQYFRRDPFAPGAPSSRHGVALRGVTHERAWQMLQACGAGKWSVAGDEVRSAFDCTPYKIATCRENDATLVARLWWDWNAVDHAADLLLNSEFTACANGLCPDFAVGEPINDGVDRCEIPFKVNGRVSKP